MICLLYRSVFTASLVDFTFSAEILGPTIAMKVEYSESFWRDRIWLMSDFRRLPMARVWPSARIGLPSSPLDQDNVKLPPLAVQDRPLELYFTYIHPIFPVVHKSCFLSEYQTR